MSVAHSPVQMDGQPASPRCGPADPRVTDRVLARHEASATEFLLQGEILLDKVTDDLDLMAVHTAGEVGEEELQWKECGHGTRIVA